MSGSFPQELMLLALLTVLVVGALAALVVRGRRQLEQVEQQAAVREQRYRSLFESSLAGIALFAADGKLLEWNVKLTTLLGAAEPDDEATAGLVRPVKWQNEAAGLAVLARRQTPGEQVETSFIAPDGIRRWVSLRYWPMNGSDTGPFWLLVHDVTRRQQTRTVLRLAQQAYASISEAIIITDVTTRIVEVNPAFERMTGYTRDEAIGMRSSLLRSPRHDAAFFAGMWRDLEKNGHWVGEIWNQCRDGAVIPCWMHIDTVKDPKSSNTSHYVGVFSDISERKTVEDRISFLAHHDPLTGLANRFSLDAVLPQSIALARRNGQRVALLFTDLDHFKTINDTLGHSAGDQVLIEVGRRLMQVVRESDFLARIGGDEFVILLNEVDGSDDALRVASQMIEALRPPILAGGIEVFVTPSIGISLFPEDGDEAATLLGHADHAMYRVKTEGRTGYRFHS
ncbi:MAG: diguanylate cyclase [Betaproteobacteria bacterium]|uniref:Diguanylate cyclase n=1 Tax=Candidatus Proximibacter danicus TaxID=2954365 RepID=A0A9D7PP63_9PROT|nr:diguanylate cyclase [Candidatus Proximibacter danicus]